MNPSHPPLLSTHEVFNQTPTLAGYNLYARYPALQEAVAREGAGWAHDWLMQRGEELGSAQMLEWATQANKFPPVLKLFDNGGNRRDEVEFHPAYHALMSYLQRHGASAGPWADPVAGSHVKRAAFFMLYAEIEDGTLCPTTMTYAVVPALMRDKALAEEWLPRICSLDYDPHFLPAAQKSGVTLGMGLTEKQGGSDVRANTTRAEPVSTDAASREYSIVGHKWFFSAPMCDAFLILAHSPGGLSCFFLPRWLPDGKLNDIRIQRLKDKLGDKSSASSEVEFWGARAWLVSEEGRGIPTILEMGTYCRLDCALGTAGLMRQSVSQALHHAHHRAAFGKLLIDQPLMKNVLADLAVESEAATALALRLARAFDAQSGEAESLLRRVLTPAAKYWVCKRGPAVSAEAMEVLGGNGYVEDGVMARVHRQMPLNSIWEGSGNVMCLDVLRAVAKHPRCLEALAAEIQPALGCDPRFDAFVDKLKDGLASAEHGEVRARQLTQGIALAVQAALLLRFAPGYVAEAFCASRLAQASYAGGSFGNLPGNSDFDAILKRAWAV
ncbi:MAG: isovaleryl-CoA dehydrogenase [Betaproteobacteria bacterium]|nr:isovaleryl-CoA dehydrogenase [Betaproteobacteria bacterium]